MARDQAVLQGQRAGAHVDRQLRQVPVRADPQLHRGDQGSAAHGNKQHPKPRQHAHSQEGGHHRNERNSAAPPVAQHADGVPAARSHLRRRRHGSLVCRPLFRAQSHRILQVSLTKRERLKQRDESNREYWPDDWTQSQERLTLCRIPTMLKSKVFFMTVLCSQLLAKS